jgi:hypothetical protein
MGDLRRIVIDDLATVWMTRGIVLMVGLGRIESLQRDYLSHDRARKNFGFFELRNVGFRNSFLFVVGVEDDRAILAALIRTLAIELRWIVRHREEHPQKLTVGDLRGIVSDLHRLGVAGFTRADQFVFCRLADPPEYPEVALITPLTCWNTA